jgi:tripartite-type tricarboxylate transporter receptor subunit TctC
MDDAFFLWRHLRSFSTHAARSGGPSLHPGVRVRTRYLLEVSQHADCGLQWGEERVHDRQDGLSDLEPTRRRCRTAMCHRAARPSFTQKVFCSGKGIKMFSKQFMAWGAALWIGVAMPTLADTYPDRPVKLVVPSAPAGAADAVARAIADTLGPKLNGSFIVENRPGAGGVLGTRQVINATADGHTLLFGLNSALVTVPYLMPKLPYEPLKDLVPIALLGKVQYVLVANPKTGIATVQDLITQARKTPARLTFASGGDGSVHHLAMEKFQRSAGISLRHVPYKAAPEGFRDVVAGHVDMMFIAVGTAQPVVSRGGLHALGVSGAKPINELPNVKPLATSVPGFTTESWFALFAPVGVSSERLNRLSAATREVLADPEVQSRFERAGVVPEYASSEELKAYVQKDIEDAIQLKKAGAHSASPEK